MIELHCFLAAQLPFICSYYIFVVFLIISWYFNNRKQQDMKHNLLKSSSESAWVISLWPNKQISMSATQIRYGPRELSEWSHCWHQQGSTSERRRERKQSGLTPTEMLSSFVSHKHGPNLLPCFSVSLSLSLPSPLICFYLRPAVPTTMIGVFTPPPPASLSNGWLPAAVEGRPFLSTALLIFHRETSPFFHSFAPQSSRLAVRSSSGSCFSPPPPSPSSFLSLDLKVWFRSWIRFRCEMQPPQTISMRSLFFFWLLPMPFSPSLWAGGRLSYMARHLGLCSRVVSLRSDWSRKEQRQQGAGVGWWRHTGCTAAAV